MGRSPIEVKRVPIRLDPDPNRVIMRFFSPGEAKRIRTIVARVLAMSDREVHDLWARTEGRFAPKHPDFVDAMQRNFERVQEHVAAGDAIDPTRARLIGAYFTMEYAVESAALFNPSMVAARDQGGFPPGSTRFLMSIRAVGEGHVSSIVFRRGVIDADCNIRIDPATSHCRQLEVIENRSFDKHLFLTKLIESGVYATSVDDIFDGLGNEFSFNELRQAIDTARETRDAPLELSATAESMLALAHSDYHLELPEGADPSELVIFPTSESESNGIEDVRLVHFTDDDGAVRYYGTYTAYNGRQVTPQILESTEFQTIRIHTMHGRYARNKGMALFPRKINGRYAMSGRLDAENLFLMTLDSVRFWNDAELMQAPKFPWEVIQIGNCGSPLETDAGWLLLTHGVGPMREYCIGASLLDRDDPRKVIGRLEEPLMVPAPDESAGYVPNVVYSCGGMIHQDALIIPYGISDRSTGFALISLPDLLTRLSH